MSQERFAAEFGFEADDIKAWEQNWRAVSAVVSGGGKPDIDDVVYLLRLGLAVILPPDVQNYLADQLKAPRKAKGRPKKRPDKLVRDREGSDRTLFFAINKISRSRRISVPKACAEYAKGKTVVLKSVERQYRAAKKRLYAIIEPYQNNKSLPKAFLSFEDMLAWSKKHPKKPHPVAGDTRRLAQAIDAALATMPQGGIDKATVRAIIRENSDK